MIIYKIFCGKQCLADQLDLHQKNNFFDNHPEYKIDYTSTHRSQYGEVHYIYVKKVK